MGRLIIIAAVAENGIIGFQGKIPWHIPEDLKRFRRLTWGHPVLMGRRTFESLNSRPLPGRRNIILTQQKFPHVETADSLESALSLLSDSEKIFVIGGSRIYAEALPMAHRLEITHVHWEGAGDTFFPTYGCKDFTLLASIHFPPHPDEKKLSYSFASYERKW